MAPQEMVDRGLREVVSLVAPHLTGDLRPKRREKERKSPGGPSGLFKPERWCDSPSPADIPRVGDHIYLPVGLQYFTTRTGTAVRLVWGDLSQGEQF